MFEGLELSWPYIRVAVGRFSSIDLASLHIHTRNDAKAFLAAYGYDIDDPLAREELWRIYFQSIAFIRDKLLDPEKGESIPEQYLTRNPNCDIVRLVMDASMGSRANNEEERLRSKWSCAILRIMHVISHLDNDVKLEHFQVAREQIFGRFDKEIVQVAPRRWQFGSDKNPIKIVRYIKKLRKDRDSVLIKLLAKPFVMAEEIYDRLGVRFVTETRLDCFRLIQYLFDRNIVCPVNINPARGVNSMMTLEFAEEIFSQAVEGLKSGKMNAEQVSELLSKLEADNVPRPEPSHNPNTSPWYRAFQFTCRQLIHAPDPTFKFWSEIREALWSDPAGAQLIKKLPVSLRETKSFYYPFEVQVMDRQSYIETIGGRSRHREYKAKQRLMARNRVFRGLFC